MGVHRLVVAALALAVAPAASQSPTFGTIFGKKQGQTMKIFAYSGTSPVITLGGANPTALPWVSVEVKFAGGTIESIATEQGVDGATLSGVRVLGQAAAEAEGGLATLWE